MIRIACVCVLSLAACVGVLSAAEPKKEEPEIKLTDPKSAMETQIRLILAGDVENLQPCFIPELRERITKNRVLLAHGELRNTSPTNIVGRMENATLEGQEVVHIYSAKGGLVTTLIHSGNSWLATTIWF